MKTSSGCIGCVTGEKASQTVNLILEKISKNICNRFKSSDYSEIWQKFWIFFQNFENSKIFIKILTSGESLWYFNDN